MQDLVISLEVARELKSLRIVNGFEGNYGCHVTCVLVSNINLVNAVR